TGTICRFSVAYWMNTRPCSSCFASGGSTISRAGGWFSIATSGEGPRMSFALCAKAVAANIVEAARATAQSSVVNIFAPFRGRAKLGYLAAQKVADQRNHLVEFVLERKMAGIDQVKFHFRKVTLVRMRAVGRKDEVVLAPDDQRRRL